MLFVTNTIAWNERLSETLNYALSHINSCNDDCDSINKPLRYGNYTDAIYGNSINNNFVTCFTEGENS